MFAEERVMKIMSTYYIKQNTYIKDLGLYQYKPNKSRFRGQMVPEVK